MNKKQFIKLFEKAIGIGGAGTVLYLLVLIAMNGEVMVYEKIPLILFTEIFLLSIGIMLMITGVFKNEY